jgi:hypothetical protein
MGPPNGLYGVPTTLAARLKSIWSHLVIKRLWSSHVTIETEIPFHNLAGTEYFKAYMDQIADLTIPKKLGNRLTVKLSTAPTNALYNADPSSFYKDIDFEQEWLRKTHKPDEMRRFVLSLVVPYVDPYNVDRQVTFHDISQAEHMFEESRRFQDEKARKLADTAIAGAKSFTQIIRQFEQSKRLTITAGTPNTITSEIPIDLAVSILTASHGDVGEANRCNVAASNTQTPGAPSHAPGAFKEHPVAASQNLVPLPYDASDTSRDPSQQPLPSPAGHAGYASPTTGLGEHTYSVPQVISLSSSMPMSGYYFVPADTISELQSMSQSPQKQDEPGNPVEDRDILGTQVGTKD